MPHNISPHSPKDIRNLAEGRRPRKVHGNTGATETIDLSDGNLHHCTLDAACTFTFTLPSKSETDGWAFDLLLKQDATGSRLATWPSSVRWTGGAAPTLTTTAGRTDWIRFVSYDAGTRWFGATVALNFNES